MNNQKLIEELAKYEFATTKEIEKDGRTFTQYEWTEQTNTQILLSIYRQLQKLLNIIITLLVLGVLGAVFAIIAMIK